METHRIYKYNSSVVIQTYYWCHPHQYEVFDLCFKSAVNSGNILSYYNLDAETLVAP